METSSLYAHLPRMEFTIVIETVLEKSLKKMMLSPLI